MEEEPVRLNNILDKLLMVFSFTELEVLMHQMVDPLDCQSTVEMAEALEKNMDLLKNKQEDVLASFQGDRENVENYVENPSNFSQAQWEAIQHVKEAMNNYEREIDIALESGKIRQEIDDGRKKLKSSRRERMKRFKARKKWIPM